VAQVEDVDNEEGGFEFDDSQYISEVPDDNSIYKNHTDCGEIAD
jgi:hypothetical protein